MSEPDALVKIDVARTCLAVFVIRPRRRERAGAYTPGSPHACLHVPSTWP